MKTKRLLKLIPFFLAGIFLIPASAADSTTNTKPQIETYRAKKSIFRDVFSSDGEKVGDITNYILQFDKTPQLRYVIIQTGGMGNVGGQKRAIPADAFTRSTDRFHVSLTSSKFNEIPVISQNRKRYLADPTNLAKLAALCNTPADHAELAGEYVFYTDLTEANSVIGGGGNELGIFEELWINYNANQAPYLQIIPTNEDLNRGREVRYNLPTSKFVRHRGGAIYFSMTVKDIAKAPMVKDVPAHVKSSGEKLMTVQSRVSE